MKLGRKDYTISVKTGTDANKAKFKKECVQGEIYHATDTGFFYIAEVTAGASDATLSKFGAPVFQNQYSVSFDGTDDYIDLGSNAFINNSSAFSISTWFKLDSWATTYPGICVIKTAGAQGFIIGLSNTSPYSGVWVGSNGTDGFRGFSTSNGALAATITSGWHHLVLTYDGVDSQASSSRTLYIDGTEYGITNHVPLGNSSNNNYIGRAANRTIDGMVDEFAIFNSALTAAQITNIYKGEDSGGSGGTNGVPGSLATFNPVGWWRMGDNDGGTGTTITDQGSGGNDGTLTNGPTFSTTVPT